MASKRPAQLPIPGISLTLPYPPSTNRIWRSSRGVTYLSREYKAFKEHVAAVCRCEGVEREEGQVSVTCRFYRPQRSGDLDGRIKALFDALNGQAWKDDAQVVELHAYRFDDKANPRCEVEITPL